MAEVTYERHEGPGGAHQLDAFLPAYEEVYAEPPYCEGPRDVAEFIDHYQVHAQRLGFRLVLAREGDEVIGFTYGYYLAPDTRWWKNLQGIELPEDFTREDGHRTFVIIELAVRKAWRRRGIAAALHTRLLDGLDAERVTLTMRPEPEAAPAQSAYATWGYRKVGGDGCLAPRPRRAPQRATGARVRRPRRTRAPTCVTSALQRLTAPSAHTAPQ